MDHLEIALDALPERRAEPDLDLGSFAVIRRRMDEHLDNIDELLLKWDFDRRGPAYLYPIARRLRVVDFGRLADLLDDAVDEERLTAEERNAIMRTDIVLSGRRRDDGQEAYLLVEISAGIGPHDVERAVDRAALLAKLGRATLPVVAGRRIHDDAAALARVLGAWVVVEGRGVTPPADI